MAAAHAVSKGGRALLTAGLGTLVDSVAPLYKPVGVYRELDEAHVGPAMSTVGQLAELEACACFALDALKRRLVSVRVNCGATA